MNNEMDDIMIPMTYTHIIKLGNTTFYLDEIIDLKQSIKVWPVMLWIPSPILKYLTK